MSMNQPTSNPGRELYASFNNSTFARIPVETHFIEIGENLAEIIQKYAKPKIQKDDVICVSCKIVSICTPGLTVHTSEVSISPLARLIVKFVKKWPNDIGYSSPRKMQVAINRAGYPRMFLALLGGTFMKLIGKPGYFYRIAGNQINAIDGFTVGYTKKQIFADYAFLPPRPAEAKKLCNELSQKLDVPVAIMDGNNIENNVMGMSDSLSKKYSEEEWKQIMSGNPQGQEDDGKNTPIVIVRKEK
jgi:hypothetical protein